MVVSLGCIEFEQWQQLGWWFQESEGLGMVDIMDSVGLRTQVYALLENADALVTDLPLSGIGFGLFVQHVQFTPHPACPT